MTGIEVMLDILAGTGVRYLFGNPGTTELPLTEALTREKRIQYILGLHEIPVVSMADGHAMASGNVAVANVHIGCGLGNAMGMLYNAYREGTPLILTAGQQDRRLAFDDPVLQADLVRVARPWTKWAAQVDRLSDLPNAVRRAVQMALTPPTGPVFLAMPVDLQMETADDLDCSPPHRPNRRIQPPVDALEAAANLLNTAKRPGILAGSRVTESDGVAALASLAELLGAPVYSESTAAHGRIPMPTDHPLYRGPIPLWSPEIHQELTEFDVIFAVGLNLLTLYIAMEPSRPIPGSVRLMQLDSDPSQLGKNFPIEVGLHGDPRSGLEALKPMLAAMQTAESKQLATERMEREKARREKEQKSLRQEIEEQWSRRPMTPSVFMGALARVLPPDIAVVEEAITTHGHRFERLGVIADPSAHFAHRGWALGWGLGCALGVKLAWPNRPVMALLGDGASMYGIQGLWTAAHHQIPVTFVVACNSEYQILKKCGVQMHLEETAAGATPGLNLEGPAIDYVGLARSMGVEAMRVEEPELLAELAREGFSSPRPRLLEVRIEGSSTRG